jgi:hypothetical protein
MCKINSGLVTDHLRTFHVLICSYKERFKNAHESTILLVRGLKTATPRDTSENTRDIFETKCRGEKTRISQENPRPTNRDISLLLR